MSCYVGICHCFETKFFDIETVVLLRKSNSINKTTLCFSSFEVLSGFLKCVCESKNLEATFKKSPVSRIMSVQEEFKKKICKEAEFLVKHFFPRKINEFDQLLRLNDFNLANIQLVRQSTNESLKNLSAIRKAVVESGEVSHSGKDHKIFGANEYIIRLMEKIKPEVITLLEAVNTLRMWVVLLIPKIEDGNNFGVEVNQIAFTALVFLSVFLEFFLFNNLTHKCILKNFGNFCLRIQNSRKLMLAWAKFLSQTSLFCLNKLTYEM